MTQGNGTALSSHSPLFTLRGHSSAVLTCAFYPSLASTTEYGSLFLTGDADGLAIIWDLNVRSPLLTLDAVATAYAQQGLKPPGGVVNPGVLGVGFLGIASKTVAGSEGASEGTIDDIQDNVVTGQSSRRRIHLRQRLRPKPFCEKCPTIQSELYFYTQCRNQSLYVWTVPRTELMAGLATCEMAQLLHSLYVPQHGFCPAASLSWESEKAYLAIPHDSDGVISVWSVGLRAPESGNFLATSFCGLQHTVGHSTMLPDGVSTVTLNEPELLPARDITQELPKTVNDKEGVDQRPTGSRDSPLELRCLRPFSVSSRIKVGAIMRMQLRRAHYLTVAFESGHVVFCRFEAIAEGVSDTPTILGVLRAFPEPALCSLWTEDCVLITSAGGHAQCYVPHYAPDGSLELQELWTATFRKGVGSAVTQSHLAILGGWDGTLRLYDTRNGRVVTILAHHEDTVNEVTIAPAHAAAYEAFGFDIRRPRCYTAESPRASSHCDRALTVSSCNHSCDVYVFASVSSDGSVAVWQVDFNSIVDESF